jgi:hypothetical protein
MLKILLSLLLFSFLSADSTDDWRYEKGFITKEKLNAIRAREAELKAEKEEEERKNSMFGKTKSFFKDLTTKDE